MKFTVDTDLKQIQLEKTIPVTDLQDLLKMLGSALKDIGNYSIAVKQPEKEYIYTPWYVPAKPYNPYDTWKYDEPYKITWMTNLDNVVYCSDKEKHDGVSCGSNMVNMKDVPGYSSFTVCMNEQ